MSKNIPDLLRPLEIEAKALEEGVLFAWESWDVGGLRGYHTDYC